MEIYQPDAAASCTSTVNRLPSAASVASQWSRREWSSKSNTRATVVFGIPGRRASSTLLRPDACNASIAPPSPYPGAANYFRTGNTDREFNSLNTFV